MTLRKEREKQSWSSCIRVASGHNPSPHPNSTLPEMDYGLPSALTYPGRYTALRCVPLRLIWLHAPRASVYSIAIRTREREYCDSRSRPIFPVPKEMSLEPNCPVHWRMSPAGLQEDYVEGWFWILDERTLARVEEIETAIARVDEPEMKIMVAAIASAEFELYDEAITLLEMLKERHRRKKAPGGRIALIQRALISVFDAMIARVPSDACLSAYLWAQSQRARLQRDLNRWLSDSSSPYYMTLSGNETVSCSKRRVSIAM